MGKRRRKGLKLTVDYVTGVVELSFGAAPGKGKSITAVYEVGWEPTVVERLASIEDAELAKRIAKWDKAHTFEFVTFDTV